MSDDGHHLLRAILAEPDDDTVRLAYADWLEEHDQHPRAEFIRLQVAAAANARGGFLWNLTGGPSPARFRSLLAAPPWESRKVMDALREPGGYAYAQASGSTSCVLWRRGFVEAFQCSGACLSRFAWKALWGHPVREVRLTSWPSRGGCERLNPGWWDHPDYPGDRHLLAVWAEGPDRCEQVMRALLSGPGGWKHLKHVGVGGRRVSKTYCPFDLVAKPRSGALDRSMRQVG